MLWIALGILYFVLLVSVGVMSLRKGHWFMFVLGIVIPLFWFIGALLPPVGQDYEVSAAMIWAILAFLGVPLWLCAAGILTLVFRNRSLQHRPGNIPVRQRLSGKTRWTRGHAVWVHDVLAFHGSPAAWREGLIWVRHASTVPAPADDQKKLRRLGDSVVIARFAGDDGETVEFASGADRAIDLVGPLTPGVSALGGGERAGLSESRGGA